MRGKQNTSYFVSIKADKPVGSKLWGVKVESDDDEMARVCRSWIRRVMKIHWTLKKEKVLSRRL